MMSSKSALSLDDVKTYEIKQILNYSDYLVVTYCNTFYIDIFKKSGSLFERFSLDKTFISSKLILKSIDFVKFAKLEWSDRYFDLVQQSQKSLPKKLILSGSFNMLGKTETLPYIVLFDRVQKQQTIVKAFMTKTQITAINYGPYDNGHVLAGLSNGTLIGFDSITMKKLFKIQVFQDNQPINSIHFDPTQLIFMTSSHS